MGGAGTLQKFNLRFLGVVTGILLFFAFFSALLGNALFDSTFYKAAFDGLGTYEQIAALAEAPVREFAESLSGPDSADSAGSVSQASTADYQQKTLLKALVEDNISGKMVRLNVDSLVDGLTAYFKGETNSLPDLHLSGTVLENVNLQVLTMYMGESRVSNLIRIISLIQFALTHIPVFLLSVLLLFLICLFYCQSYQIRLWLRTTAFTSFLISSIASIAILLFPGFLEMNLLLNISPFPDSSKEVLTILLTYVSSIFAFFILISGTIAFAAVETLNFLYCRYEKNFTLDFPARKNGTHSFRLACFIAILLFLGTVFYSVIYLSEREFDKRNLGQSLSLLWTDNPLYHVTNARDDLVYLLVVHITEGNTGKPAKQIGVAVTGSEQNNAYKDYRCMTDQDGNATFLLRKGQYTLTLDSNNPFSGYSTDHTGHMNSYEFDMQTPGKSVLNAVITGNTANPAYLADASLLFVP